MVWFINQLVWNNIGTWMTQPRLCLAYWLDWSPHVYLVFTLITLLITLISVQFKKFFLSRTAQERMQKSYTLHTISILLLNQGFFYEKCQGGGAFKVGVANQDFGTGGNKCCMLALWQRLKLGLDRTKNGPMYNEDRCAFSLFYEPISWMN